MPPSGFVHPPRGNSSSRGTSFLDDARRIVHFIVVRHGFEPMRVLKFGLGLHLETDRVDDIVLEAPVIVRRAPFAHLTRFRAPTAGSPRRRSPRERHEVVPEQRALRNSPPNANHTADASSPVGVDARAPNDEHRRVERPRRSPRTRRLPGVHVHATATAAVPPSMSRRSPPRQNHRRRTHPRRDRRDRRRARERG